MCIIQQFATIYATKQSTKSYA
jgi:hypothetical protein